MNTTSSDYARTQADGLDNIAPTTEQGQRAWQYAQSDNFFSPEERTAVLKREIEPHRAAIEGRLSEVGYPPEHFALNQKDVAAFFSGQQTDLMTIRVAEGINMEGRLRVVITDQGPDIRFTPVERQLTIPNEISGIRLSQAEQTQLAVEGSLPRPFLIPDKGEYVPTYLRIDEQTNTVELWRIRPEQLPTKLMGIDLTKDQQLQLVSGNNVHLMGLLDSKGEPFNATVNISPGRKTLQFSNFDRIDVALRPDNEFRQQVALNNDGAKTDLTRSREASIGSPVVSNQQTEAVKQLLTTEPHQENTRNTTRSLK